MPATAAGADRAFTSLARPGPLTYRSPRATLHRSPRVPVMRPLLATAMLAVAAAPAVACINDSELPTHEREFRSSYQADRKPGEPKQAMPAYLPAVAAIAGGLLLVGAAVVTLRRK